MSDDKDEPPSDKSLFLFGRDVSKIPCFRNSILYGIYGGFAGGLSHFMFRSKPLAACNFGVYSFCTVTLIYWAQCRYKYSKTKFEMMRMQELMRRNAMFEGTIAEENVKESNK